MKTCSFQASPSNADRWVDQFRNSDIAGESMTLFISGAVAQQHFLIFKNISKTLVFTYVSFCWHQRITCDFWNRHPESSGVASRTTWNNLELCGAIWCHLELSGAIWSHLGPSDWPIMHQGTSWSWMHLLMYHHLLIVSAGTRLANPASRAQVVIDACAYVPCTIMIFCLNERCVACKLKILQSMVPSVVGLS